MNNSEQERNELKAIPLPFGPEDVALPTRAHEIETLILFKNDEISRLHSEIRELEFDRMQILKRAAELKIVGDDNYKIIEEPVYGKRHVDVPTLKRVANDKYEIIIARIKENLKIKYDESVAKTETFISQDDVKKVVTEKGLLAQIIPPAEMTGTVTVIVKR